MSEKIEKVTDDQLINTIDKHIRNSSGGYMGSTDVNKRRENSIYEMSLEPRGDLAPQGVSKIVSSDSAEIAEGYTALLTKLLIDNNKLAMFVPYADDMGSCKRAKMASDVVNYCIFNSNSDGWTKISTWLKSAVVLGNSAITWGWEEDFDYEVEEYEIIDQLSLDNLLSDPMLELIGDLELSEELSSPEEDLMFFTNVRLRRTVDKSGVKLRNIPPESFIVDRAATSVKDAKFVACVTDMTRSDIRRLFPDFDGDIEDLGEELSSHDFNIDNFARKDAAGITTWDVNSDEDAEEANIEVTVIECWIRTDRDGDGIAELKHVIKAGNVILEEDDVSYIPLAMLNPIEIPHEFYGLSLLDMARSQTQATTAILRGFVENVYFGNYGRTLADPNVVDFSALQNPMPKQIIPTNGNPAAAVQQLQPEPISPGTAGMLEFLGLQKEQATGLTKTAMGLNDTLYVSGNSETKMQGAQTAAQIRIEHIARRFVESGIKDLCRGILREMKSNMKNPQRYKSDQGYASISPEDLQMLPANMDLDIQANLGENSNQSMGMKLNQLAELLPVMAQDPSAAPYLNQQATFNLASDILKNMGLDPTRFLVDPDDEIGQQQVQQKQQEAEQEKERARDLALQNEQMAVETSRANIGLIKAEVDNKKIDNKRQLLSAEDESNRKWAEVQVKAMGTEGAKIPPKISVDFQSLYQDTEQQEQEQAQMQQQQQQQVQQLVQMAQENPEQAMQMAQQAGIDPAQIQQVVGQMQQ
jgi:hypothetical protein